MVPVPTSPVAHRYQVLPTNDGFVLDGGPDRPHGRVSLRPTCWLVEPLEQPEEGFSRRFGLLEILPLIDSLAHFSMCHWRPRPSPAPAWRRHDWPCAGPSVHCLGCWTGAATTHAWNQSGGPGCPAGPLRCLLLGWSAGLARGPFTIMPTTSFRKTSSAIGRRRSLCATSETTCWNSTPKGKSRTKSTVGTTVARPLSSASAAGCATGGVSLPTRAAPTAL